MRTLSFFGLSVFILLGTPAVAQDQDATVSFRLFWKEAHPSKFTITVHRNGHAE